MSTREHLYQLAAEAISSWKRSFEPADYEQVDGKSLAEAVVDTLLPLITKPEQLAGVPELSLLITGTRPVATVYQWRGGSLYEDTDGSDIYFLPESVIADEGPLTIVWMP